MASALVLVGCEFEIALDVDVDDDIRVPDDDQAIYDNDPDIDLREGTLTVPTGESIHVLYEVRDGIAYLGEDVVLGLAADLEDDGGFRSAAIDAWAWPEATVVYRLDDSLTAAHIEIMQGVMLEWSEATGLQFEEAAPSALGGYVRIQASEPGCWATLGAAGPYEEHSLNIGDGCNDLATWRHEFGHAIGLMHEQARSDRDEHVVINWDNIRANKAYAFDRYEARGIPGVDRGPYDLESVMHYRSFSFAKDRSRPTIWAKDGSLIKRDDSTPISAGDAAAVIAMYGLDVPGGTGQEVGAGSCEASCELSSGIDDADGGLCYCDAACLNLGDCCSDYDQFCSADEGPTCAGHCGDLQPVDDWCYCDAECEDFGDCCDDYAAECVAGPSCAGHCGSEQPIDSCFCDDECEDFGDCCADYSATCG